MSERNLTYHHFQTLLADEWRVIEEDEETLAEVDIACFAQESDAALFVRAVKAEEDRQREEDLRALKAAHEESK